MVLVDYSDSDSEPEPAVTELSKVNDNEVASQKRKRGGEDYGTGSPATRLPPLPSSFHSLYATNIRMSISDDPELHGGRTRQVPHVEGHWPTHVYLEWYPTKIDIETLERFISSASTTPRATPSSKNERIHGLLQSDLGAQLPLHISLSAPLVLQTNQRADFELRLEYAVSLSGIHSFKTRCSSLDWVPNFDKSRFFLVVRLSQPVNNELNRLLHASNECASFFAQPLLYSPGAPTDSSAKSFAAKKRSTVADFSAAFHISIAWKLDEPSEAEKKEIAAMDIANLQDIRIRFDTLKIKIGNAVKNVVMEQSDY